MSEASYKSQLFKVAVLPLRDTVVFPHMVLPLFVGRKRSIAAIDHCHQAERDILLITQRDAELKDPDLDGLYSVGTLCTVMPMLRLADGTIRVLIEGKRRAQIVAERSHSDYLSVNAAELVPAQPAEAALSSDQLEQLKGLMDDYARQTKLISIELSHAIRTIDRADRLTDTIAAQLGMPTKAKQALLESISVNERYTQICAFLKRGIDDARLKRNKRRQSRQAKEAHKREFFLNEQMQAFQRELGERDEFKNEIHELEEQIARKSFSAEADEKLEKELRKLKMMTPLSPEATVIRNYIDWVLSLPWNELSTEQIDLTKAQAVLDEDHHGLAKIKQRIIEHLAVHALAMQNERHLKGPILCLVGPPGVGKTSLGRSIARATGRDFVRLSLGGVRDEAEIRGHRRTYVGALPGKIIQHLKKAGHNNPVFLLDEIDKMSTDFRGDPSAALLEVLDPEQNQAFNDHYLELDYDLSDVMFITTANDLHSIPVPLQDRMEILQLTGYTEDEKIHIATKHLLPKQVDASGLFAEHLQVSEAALRAIVRDYTKEAGVRGLERQLAAVCRKVARDVLEAPQKKCRTKVTVNNVNSFLGVPTSRHRSRQQADFIGQANGLAVTALGGELLTTEVSVLPGRGKLVLTGKLGDVMQESAQAAFSYVRSRALSLGLDAHFYRNVDLHVHCPEGAIPKDGPSAGITITSAMVSALLHLPIRNEIALTGEITLRGRILAVGGIKEKLVAAHRASIGTVIIPTENERELKDVPENVVSTLKIVTADHMDDVLKRVLKLSKTASFLNKPSQLVDWRLVKPPAERAH